VFGESGAVNMHLLKAAFPSLQIAIAQFSPEDVFNMDETGLFFAKAPTSTISSQPIEGFKVD